MSDASQLKESILRGIKALRLRVEDLKELEDLRSRGLKVRYWRIARKEEETAAAAEQLEAIAASLERGETPNSEMAAELRKAAAGITDYHEFISAIAETEGLSDGKISVIRDIRGILNDIDVTKLSNDVAAMVERRSLNLFWRSLAQNLVFFALGMAASFLIGQLFN